MSDSANRGNRGLFPVPSGMAQGSEESAIQSQSSGLTVIAMSGGVDSSAAAALLQETGAPVVGLTMQLWNQRRLPEISGSGGGQRCCSLDDVYDAKRVAQHLGLPHY